MRRFAKLTFDNKWWTSDLFSKIRSTTVDEFANADSTSNVNDAMAGHLMDEHSVNVERLLSRFRPHQNIAMSPHPCILQN